MKQLTGLAVGALLLGFWPPVAAGDVLPEPQRVLLIVNDRVPASADVAQAYRRLHSVASEHTVTVSVEPGDVVSRSDYERLIEQPVARWLTDRAAIDAITYIVLMPGLPVRVAGSAGRDGTASSVDSELSLLYRRLTGANVPIVGRVPNPYFSEGPLTDPSPFDRRAHDIYLVTRLDGSSPEAALELVRRGGGEPHAWRVVIDGRPGERGGAERRWLQEVAPRLAAVQPGVTVSIDESSTVVTSFEPVTGYFSWGSNDSGTRRPAVTFDAGAIAASFMSADARTLTPPPVDWQPGRWEQPESFYAGSPEALAVDWLDAGLTGLGAMVAEPYLDGAFRPATLFEAWARGYSLGESFYLALPYLSWQSVVFGDPLARATKPAWPPVPDTGLDETTGLPAVYLTRLARVARERYDLPGDEESRLWVRASRAFNAGQVADSLPLLEELSIRAPDFVPAHLLLAQAYEQRGAHDLARTRYAFVLERDRNNVVALNNLAFNLAVQAGDVASAVPLADRLQRLAPGSPAILDTVGWVWHLAGRSAEAADIFRKVTSEAPALCEGWEHYAAVLLALSRDIEAAEASTRATACRASAGAGEPAAAADER